MLEPVVRRPVTDEGEEAEEAKDRAEAEAMGEATRGPRVVADGLIRRMVMAAAAVAVVAAMVVVVVEEMAMG